MMDSAVCAVVPPKNYLVYSKSPVANSDRAFAIQFTKSDTKIISSEHPNQSYPLSDQPVPEVLPIHPFLVPDFLRPVHLERKN